MASLSLRNIYKIYPGDVTAVSDFNLEIEDKEFIVLVGPSGCGKSTTLRMVAGLEDISKGELYIDDKLVNNVPPKDRDIAMVFQSYALYPHMTVYNNMAFGLKLRKMPKDEIDRRVKEAAQILGIEKLLNRKPAALSGGQRQRISIARGLIMEPEVLVCDEVVSALDVSVQAQILNLLQDLRKKRGLSFLFIAHDLKVSCWFCDTIGVMYRGMLVEEGPAKDMYKDAVHPYTQALFAGAGGNYKIEKNGEMNTLLESPKGCPYAHRCSRASEKCREEIPEWKEVSEGHKIRCFNA